MHYRKFFAIDIPVFGRPYLVGIYYRCCCCCIRCRLSYYITRYLVYLPAVSVISVRRWQCIQLYTFTRNDGWLYDSMYTQIIYIYILDGFKLITSFAFICPTIFIIKTLQIFSLNAWHAIVKLKLKRKKNVIQLHWNSHKFDPATLTSSRTDPTISDTIFNILRPSC